MRLLMGLLMAVMLVAAAPVTAQEEPDLYIYVQVNESGTSSSDFAPGQSLYADEILTKLNAFFGDSPLRVVFITDTAVLSDRLPFVLDKYDSDFVFLPDSPTLPLSIDTYGTRDAVALTPFAGFTAPPLPTGTFGWSVFLMFGQETETKLDDVIAATAALGGYIARDCDYALPFITEILASEGAIAEGVLVEPGFYAYQGACHYLTGDEDAALAAYEQAITFDTPVGDRDPRIYTLDAATHLAWLHLQRGDEPAVRALLETYEDVELPVYQSYGGFVPVLAQIDLYVALGETDAAFALYQELIDAIELRLIGFETSELARIYAERGNLHAQLGDNEAAFADFETAIEIDPTYPKVYYYRALLHESEGDTNAAQDDYAAFIELEADFYNYYEEDLGVFVAAAEQALAE